MIQRIQSVFLFLTTILSFLFLKGGILNFISGSGEAIKVTFSGILKTVNGNSEIISRSLLLTIIIVLIAVISLIAIFLYKNRNLQMKVTGVLIGLSVILILDCGYYAYLVISKYDGTLVPGIKMVLPLIILILAALAYRGIKKDEQLVKSYDRLR
jgi:hypothetical protein